MAKWGKADFNQLLELQKRLQKLQAIDLNKFCEDASKELAARLLALVIPRTPVGDYGGKTGKNGGTLRRGWTAGKQTAAGVYAKGLQVEKSGDYYIIRVINPIYYASYVEFGHRTADHKGWVEGQFFMTLSEDDLESIAPNILEKKLDKLLREAFNGEN